MRGSVLKKVLCCALVAVVSMGALGVQSGVVVDGATAVYTSNGITVTRANSKPLCCSGEYMKSKFYTKLWDMRYNLRCFGMTTMYNVYSIASTQVGYKNYATYGNSNAHNWTGETKRMNGGTGNTEYTRWLYATQLGQTENQYADVNWCAIFVSWCMFHAGYKSTASDKAKWYSVCADPRKDYVAPIETFWLDQRNVWYTTSANYKLQQAKNDSRFETVTSNQVNLSGYNLPYKKGGLVFFNWGGDNFKYFHHVGIVESYDTKTHVLTYISGNDKGEVRRASLDLDTFGTREGEYMRNARRIMAYAEY